MILDMKVAQEQLLILFEQHLFIFADPFNPPDVPTLNGDYIEIKMNFNGDLNGKFVMLFPEDKSVEVMCNFLGLESDDAQIAEMSHFDAAAEIMNILGAHILSSWLKDKGQFKIGLPETSFYKSNEHQDFLKSPNITGIAIDGEPVFLKIVFN